MTLREYDTSVLLLMLTPVLLLVLAVALATGSVEISLGKAIDDAWQAGPGAVVHQPG